VGGGMGVLLAVLFVLPLQTPGDFSRFERDLRRSGTPASSQAAGWLGVSWKGERCSKHGFN
jgi:hypothetical protein